MIESYGYQPLRGLGYSDVNVLIPTTGHNQKITIRLSDYTDLFPAHLAVDDENIYGSSSRVIPVRNLANQPSFNFSKLTEDKRPASGDADVNVSGSSSANIWYVSLFAVAVGQDYTYSPVYSNILYLGSVPISVE